MNDRWIHKISMKTESFSRNKQRNFTRSKIFSLLQSRQNPIGYLDIFNHVNQYSWITPKTISNMLGSNADDKFIRRNSGWTFKPEEFKRPSSPNFQKLEINFSANFRKCPHCGSETKLYMIACRKLAKCGRCQTNTTAITGTIFGDSKIPVQKLVLALGLFNQSEGKISTHKLARDLKITQKSAWKLKSKMINRVPAKCTVKDDLNNSESVNDWNKSEIDLNSRSRAFKSLDAKNQITEKELYETENSQEAKA